MQMICQIHRLQIIIYIYIYIYKHPQVTDEQLDINTTEELSRRSSPSTEQQLQCRVKELEKELEAIQKDRA